MVSDEPDPPESDEPPRKYRVTVKTGYVPFAGTDANISIMLIGESGLATRWMDLKNVVNLHKHLNLFEIGKRDVFNVRGAAVGKIARLRVRMDGFGPSPDWCT